MKRWSHLPKTVRRRLFTPPHVYRMVSAYWIDRQGWETQAEAACRGHMGGLEEAEYRSEHPPPALRDYMQLQDTFVQEVGL